MGMDLTNANGEYFRFNRVGWGKVLALAKMGGWDPAGTVAPPRGDPASWGGDYFTNSGQQVTEADALAIAEALESVMDDIPDHDDLPEKRIEYDAEAANEIDDPFMRLVAQHMGGSDILEGPNYQLSPIEFFGGEYKEWVRDFITYCRQGGFRIY